jgi:hypothetical protein
MSSLLFAYLGGVLFLLGWAVGVNLDAVTPKRSRDWVAFVVVPLFWPIVVPVVGWQLLGEWQAKRRLTKWTA